MAFVCYEKAYVCGTNADGTAMICTDRECGWVPDNWDPFGSGLVVGPAGNPAKPGDFNDVVADIVRTFDAFGLDVSSLKAQLDAGGVRERLAAGLAGARRGGPDRVD